MHTALVVPCFNEAARLDGAEFVRRLEADPQLHLVFADDGSTDGTAALLTQLAEAHPGRVTITTLPQNRGKAEAVRRGTLAALEREPDLVGYWDADLATPLDALDEMRTLFQGQPEALVVMGARVKLLGRSIERKATRHYIGRIFATFASRILGMAVYDTQCGAKLFRVTPLTHRLFEAPFVSRWLFDVELLARLRKALHADPSPVVIEHPLRQWHDVKGSKLRIGDFVAAGFSLVRIAWTYR